VKSWTRPDGRCFVFGEPDGVLPPGRVHVMAAEGDRARLALLKSLGFAQTRREFLLRLPSDPDRWSVGDVARPPGIAFRPADQVDETRLRLLDDLLRQEVPGTDGWRWDEEAFREETYESPHFDPKTYFVAVADDEEYVGIARVWMRPEKPRLGFIGVRADWRRRGLARSLVAAVLTVVRERGIPEVQAEVDETNLPSRMLLARFGAQWVATSVELVRQQSSV